MSTFLYTRPSDRLIGTMAVNTGSEDAAYLAANLDDSHPEKPAKLSTTTGSWRTDLATAQRVDITAIIHPNFDAGLDVRIQANATDVWTTPTLNYQVTIPARHADLFPVNVWVNLKKIFPLDANRTFRYWRLLINTANSVAVAVGEWPLYQTRRDLGVRNIAWGSTRSFRRPSILHQTDLLVRHAYDYGTTLRAVQVETTATETTLSDIETWFRDSQGITKPFLIVPHEDETDAWMVTFLNPDQPYERNRRNANLITMAFQEQSRGLYPTP